MSLKHMKSLIVLVGLMVVGCATTPTMKSVAGTYEGKEGEDTERGVLLENGIAESYTNGKKLGEEAKWSISKEDEIHVTGADGGIGVFRINKDKSITYIARISNDGKREEAPKEDQETFKKIK